MSGFEQQAAGAVLDLTQDEEQDMKKMKSIKKWYEWNFKEDGGKTGILLPLSLQPLGEYSTPLLPVSPLTPFYYFVFFYF